MSEKRHSRRKFLKYAGVGVVAAAAGIGYLTRDYWNPRVPNPTTPSPTMLPTETSTPKPLKAAFDYSPKNRFILIDPELAAKEGVKFTNLTEYERESRPEVEWKVDYKIVSKDWDCSIKLAPGSHEVRLTARAGSTSDSTSVYIDVDEDLEYPEKKVKVPIKGMAYTVGVADEFSQRPPSEDQMREHLSVIKKELGCNGIRIVSDLDDILYKCAEMAIEMDYECILLSPFWVNRTPEETVNKMIDFSKNAERLRKIHNGIQLNLVEEPSTSTRGILDDSPTWVMRTSTVPHQCSVFTHQRITAQKPIEPSLFELASCTLMMAKPEDVCVSETSSHAYISLLPTERLSSA